MKVNTNIILASTDFSGFKNYDEATFSVAYGGGNIAVGSYAGVFRASTPLNNSKAISEVQVRYTGIESFYQKVPGNVVNEYPSASLPSYEIQTLTYFNGGVLYVDSYIINETAGIISVPAITFDCRAFLYAAPFN